MRISMPLFDQMLRAMNLVLPSKLTYVSCTGIIAYRYIYSVVIAFLPRNYRLGSLT